MLLKLESNLIQLPVQTQRVELFLVAVSCLWSASDPPFFNALPGGGLNGVPPRGLGTFFCCEQKPMHSYPLGGILRCLSVHLGFWPQLLLAGVIISCKATKVEFVRAFSVKLGRMIVVRSGELGDSRGLESDWEDTNALQVG